MGIALVLFGVLVAGVLTAFIVENDLADATERTYELFGGSFELSEAQVLIGAAVLGALALGLVLLGMGVLRGSWGRRRARRGRISELERENAELRASAARARTVEVVHEDERKRDVLLPEREPVVRREHVHADRPD